MTSIVNVSLHQNIFAQVKWKCKVYSSMFSSVIIVHLLLGLLMFSAGSINMGAGGSFIDYTENMYTLDVIFYISIMVLLFMGWSLASKTLLNQNFSIVSTSLSETFSSLLFLVLLSLFTLCSAMASTCISFVVGIFVYGDETILVAQLMPQWLSLMMFFVVVLLAGSLSYLLKSLYDFSKIAFVVVVALIGFAIYTLQVDIYSTVFGQEIWTVTLRSLIYICVCWSLAIVCKKQNEVIRR